MGDNDALEAHLHSGRFMAGAAKGRWRLLELQWPRVYIEVPARDGRRFVLRFECSGYPDAAPTATLWDREGQQQLPAERWPRGGRVSQVFNVGWKGGSAIHPLRPGEHSGPRELALRASVAHLELIAWTPAVRRDGLRNPPKQ